MGSINISNNRRNISNMKDQKYAGVFKVRIKLIIFKCPVKKIIII